MFKVSFSVHTQKVDTANTIRALNRAVSSFGPPARVIADEGRCFTSKEFRDFCTSQNIQLHIKVTIANRANDQDYRVTSTLKNTIMTVERIRTLMADGHS